MITRRLPFWPLLGGLPLRFLPDLGLQIRELDDRAAADEDGAAGERGRGEGADEEREGEPEEERSGGLGGDVEERERDEDGREGGGDGEEGLARPLPLAGG